MLKEIRYEDLALKCNRHKKFNEKCEDCIDQKRRDLRRWKKNQWRLANKERHDMWKQRESCNRRARKYGAKGTFTYEEHVAILERQKHRCNICNKKSKLTIDHIVPLSRKGSNFAKNLQGLCGPCNSRKGDRLMSELYEEAS